jgi:hypothetical protein
MGQTYRHKAVDRRKPLGIEAASVPSTCVRAFRRSRLLARVRPVQKTVGHHSGANTLVHNGEGVSARDYLRERRAESGERREQPSSVRDHLQEFLREGLRQDQLELRPAALTAGGGHMGFDRGLISAGFESEEPAGLLAVFEQRIVLAAGFLPRAGDKLGITGDKLGITVTLASFVNCVRLTPDVNVEGSLWRGLAGLWFRNCLIT